MILDTLKALATSKKFLSAVAGVLAMAGVRFIGLPEAEASALSMQIMGIVAALLIGQGVTDLGKEKAKVERDGTMDVLSAFPELSEDDED